MLIKQAKLTYLKNKTLYLFADMCDMRNSYAGFNILPPLFFSSDLEGPFSTGKKVIKLYINLDFIDIEELSHVVMWKPVA